MATYSEHFSRGELECPCGCGQCDMDADLMVKLEKMRYLVGGPLQINSGYRCQNHNTSVGGVSSSSHTTGHAVDIRCSTSSLRHDILASAFLAGFTRIGVSKNFIHVDNDELKARDVVWVY